MYEIVIFGRRRREWLYLAPLYKKGNPKPFSNMEEVAIFLQKKKSQSHPILRFTTYSCKKKKVGRAVVVVCMKRLFSLFVNILQRGAALAYSSILNAKSFRIDRTWNLIPKIPLWNTMWKLQKLFWLTHRIYVKSALWMSSKFLFEIIFFLFPGL